MSLNERTKHAVLTLVVGLALNITLGVAKLVVGVLAGSASVTSDAVNNLSDAVVSVMTVVATALAARAADHDHPYGHGRYEYIATFILGAVIVAVGAEVLSSGIKRIVTPETVLFDTAVWATLGAAIAVKLFMAVFYTVHGRRIKSETIRAAAVDSVSDVVVTSVVLCCALAQRYTGANIDGYASVAVALVILVLGIRIVKQTVSRLLGERPDAELYERVQNIILGAPQVLSMHDLIINDYGSAFKIAEADAVFPAEMSFVDVHAACDEIERAVYEKERVRLCIHADPLITTDERLEEIRTHIEQTLSAFGATAHDVAINDERKCVTLDIKLANDDVPRADIVAQTEAAVRSVVPYAVEVNVDYI